MLLLSLLASILVLLASLLVLRGQRKRGEGVSRGLCAAGRH